MQSFPDFLTAVARAAHVEIRYERATRLRLFGFVELFFLCCLCVFYLPELLSHYSEDPQGDEAEDAHNVFGVIRRRLSHARPLVRLACADASGAPLAQCVLDAPAEPAWERMLGSLLSALPVGARLDNHVLGLPAGSFRGGAPLLLSRAPQKLEKARARLDKAGLRLVEEEESWRLENQEPRRSAFFAAVHWLIHLIGGPAHLFGRKWREQAADLWADARGVAPARWSLEVDAEAVRWRRTRGSKVREDSLPRAALLALLHAPELRFADTWRPAPRAIRLIGTERSVRVPPAAVSGASLASFALLAEALGA